MAACELIPGSRPKPIVNIGWHQVNLKGPFKREFELEVYNWVSTNVKDEWLWSPYLGMGQALGLHFQFENKNEAMLFKMAWVGTCELLTGWN